MKTEVPDFLIELSKQMNSDPNNATAHPFWQVRCKRYVPTADGCSEHHYVLHNEDEDEVFYRSDTDSLSDLEAYFAEHYSAWVVYAVDWNDSNLLAKALEDGDFEGIPFEVSKIPMQEVEEVVSTHLTKSAADRFIARKQHDYPPLYTYTESAYWSPQFRELQDWIKSLTGS